MTPDALDTLEPEERHQVYKMLRLTVEVCADGSLEVSGVLGDSVVSGNQDEGLIFATQRGTLVNPTNLRKRSFAPLLEKAGLPTIRFHDLRHTCATLLLSRNVNPKIVSEMLGHSSIAITLDTYSHVLPNMQGSAARALEDALR